MRFTAAGVATLMVQVDRPLRKNTARKMATIELRTLPATALAVTLLSSSAATAQDTAQYGKLIHAFLQRPEQMQAQSTALGTAWGRAAGPCQKVDVAGDTLSYLSPLTFDAEGTPLSGMWKETVESKGCGRSRTLNLFFVADGSGQVQRVFGAPGGTRADPVLQNDSVRYVLAGASGYISRQCNEIRLVDTQYVSPEGPPMPGGKSDRWKEYWTLVGCGVGAQVTMHFIPDATGTTIEVKPDETKRTEVP